MMWPKYPALGDTLQLYPRRDVIFAGQAQSLRQMNGSVAQVSGLPATVKSSGFIVTCTKQYQINQLCQQRW